MRRQNWFYANWFDSMHDFFCNVMFVSFLFFKSILLGARCHPCIRMTVQHHLNQVHSVKHIIAITSSQCIYHKYELVFATLYCHCTALFTGLDPSTIHCDNSTFTYINTIIFFVYFINNKDLHLSQNANTWFCNAGMLHRLTVLLLLETSVPH